MIFGEDVQALNLLFEGIQVMGGVVMGMGASIYIDSRAVSNLFGNIYDEEKVLGNIN